MHDIFYKFYERRIENMDFELLKSRINNRKVYIWGADQKGIWLESILNKKGIVVTGYLDGNIEKYNAKRPEEILYEGSNKKYFIIVSMFLKHEKYILDYFLQNKYSYDDFYYPFHDWNFIHGSIKKTFDYNSDIRYQKGELLAKNLDEDKMYFLLYGGHIGDEALALSWIKAFKEQHYIKEITIITSKLYKQLTNLYSSYCDEVEVWEKEDLEALRIYSISGTSTSYNLVGANWIWFPQERRIQFPMNQVVYKTMHLGIPYNVPSEYYAGIPNKKEFEKIIEENNIEKGKMVLLIPYSRSAKMLPDTFWEKLAKRLSEKYVVYTNVGEDEQPIKGTKPLFLPLDMLGAVVNYGGYAISIRCGISDLLALGKCENAYVLYYLWNDIEENYANINQLYINGMESVLYRNAIKIKPEDDLTKILDVIESKLGI